MTKRWWMVAGVLVVVALAASIAQAVSHHFWERRVWSCYKALGSGDAALKPRFVMPPVCTPSAILVGNLGAPDAEVLLRFEPPVTMWLSYLLKTSEYDTYVIEIRARDGVTRARLHHGSD